MRNLIKNLYLSPDDDMGLEDFMEDGDLGEDDGTPEDQQEQEQSVAQVSLEDAMQMLQQAGYQVAAPGTLTPQQEQASQQTMDYARMIPVPEEVKNQGWEAEQRYIAIEAAKMTQAQMLAPMLGQFQASQIATQVNRPDLAPVINAKLSEAIGPNWYEMANNPQLSAIMSLTIKGIVAEAGAGAPKDKARVPKMEPIGRQTSQRTKSDDPLIESLMNDPEAQAFGITPEMIYGGGN